eukprot:scaffold2041_cov251-Pinguiococcus_pyrenoidosus.AAC.5
MFYKESPPARERERRSKIQRHETMPSEALRWLFCTSLPFVCSLRSPSIRQDVLAFEAWFAERGGDVGAVRLHNFQGFGLGLQATRRIDTPTIVTSVPRSLCLTVEWARRHRACADVPEALADGLGDSIVAVGWAAAEAVGALESLADVP